MDTVLSKFTVSVTNLKRHYADILKQAEEEPVAVLNHNRVMAYMVPADRYEAMMEQLDDLALVEIIKRRAEETPLRVSLDEL